MTTKMKGFLKGLRYISQIFDNEDKRPEMQIGFPTDVKHVAHIGWDGPTKNTPTWMNEFSTIRELSSGSLNSIGEAKETSATKQFKEDLNRTGAGIQGMLQNFTEIKNSSRHRPSSGSSSPIESPTRRSLDAPKQSRRHRSTGASVDSPAQDPSVNIRPSRRHHNSGPGLDSPAHDPPAIPKRSGRKKKGSSGGGSTRSSRSKGQNSLTDPFSESGFGSGSGQELQNSVLEVFEEEKECEEEISRGMRNL